MIDDILRGEESMDRVPDNGVAQHVTASQEVHKSSNGRQRDKNSDRSGVNNRRNSFVDDVKLSDDTLTRCESIDAVGTAPLCAVSPPNRKRRCAESSLISAEVFPNALHCSTSSREGVVTSSQVLSPATPLLTAGCRVTGDLLSSATAAVGNREPMLCVSGAVRPTPVRPNDAIVTGSCLPLASEHFDNCGNASFEQQSVYQQLQAAVSLVTPSAGSQHRHIYALHQQQQQQPPPHSPLSGLPGSLYGHHHRHHPHQMLTPPVPTVDHT
jgi:hypothetical protein